MLDSIPLPCCQGGHLRQPCPRQALRGDGGYPMAHLPSLSHPDPKHRASPFRPEPKSYPPATRAESSEEEQIHHRSRAFCSFPSPQFSNTSST